MGLGPRVLKFDGLLGRGWWWRLRRSFYNAAFGGPPPPLRGPPLPDERWEASLKVVVSFPPTKWDRQGLRQRSSPPCYLPTPFPGVGGERSETEGGGWMGRSAARVHRAQRGRFLRWTGPLGRRVCTFDGLSGRGWWWRLRRKFYKAAFGGPPPPLRGPPPPPTSSGRQV